MVKIHVRWKTEQATGSMTWTELTLAVNTMPEGIIDLQLHLIENKQDYNRIYLWNLLLNCFHMGMNLGCLGFFYYLQM